MSSAAGQRLQQKVMTGHGQANLQSVPDSCDCQ